MEGTDRETIAIKSTDPQLKRSNDQETLPVELWDHIASLIEADADLAALCQTSRMLQSASERQLYHKISLGTAFNRPVRQNKLMLFARSMESVPLQALVTSLSIYLLWCNNRKECSCSTLERLLGDIVTPLCNLQHLSIRCVLCKSTTRHSYFQRLSTRRLKSLVFKCQCHDGKSAALLENFTGECMQTVTHLEWLSEFQIYPHDSRTALIESDRFFPNVKQVSSSVLTPFIPHLRRGGISHLRCIHLIEQLPDVLTNSPASLETLHIPGAALILPVITQSPSPYLNIQRMSNFEFWFNNNVDVIPTTLEVLCHLPYLNIIGIKLHFDLQFDTRQTEMYQLFHNNEQDRSLVCSLAKQVKTLFRVGVYTCLYNGAGIGLSRGRTQQTYQVWECNGVWKKAEVEVSGYRKAIEGEGWIEYFQW